MALPRKVQEQADAADAAIDAMQKEQDAETATATPLAEAVDQTPAVPATELEGQVVESPEPEPEPAPAPLVDVNEQRYRTLLGKYNAEVPRLHQALTNLQDRLQAVEAVRRQEPPVAVDPKVFDSAHRKHLSETELKEYGEEVLGIQARVARGVAEAAVEARVSPLVSDLSARISELENRLLSQAGMTFWQQVDAKYPGAKAINDSDPDWNAFLDTEEVNSGSTYRSIGERAVGSGDVARVIRLFDTFRPRADASNGTARAPAVRPRKTGGGSVPSAPAPAVKIRESDMTKFYDDVRRGKYRGREAEQEAAERAIMDAMTSGNMVPG